MVLRQFLYLDHPLVQDYLAQLEGGIADEAQQKTERRGSKKAGAGAGFASLKAELGGETGTTEELQRVVRQTRASDFDRLYKALAGSGEITELPPVDDEIWDGLGRGQIVEIEARVALSGVTKLFKFADDAQSLLAASQLFGEEVDKETIKTLASIQALGQLTQGPDLPVVVSVASVPRYKFVTKLRTGCLGVAADDLEGEATMLGKVQRKLRKGEDLPVTDIVPGMSFFPKAQRKELERNLSKVETGDQPIGDMSVRYPAALLGPIAIYR